MPIVLSNILEEIRELIPGPPDSMSATSSHVLEYDDGVTLHRNVVYFEGEARDAYRHRLDLCVPAPDRWHSGRPLVVWLHGGGWRLGSKDDMLGLYTHFGLGLARRGIAFAAPNYRLTPRVEHPGHVRDAAAATAWLIDRAGEFGYRPEALFLSGHSAGAHLAALMATDPRWLGERNVPVEGTIRGVIALSGLYDLRGLESWFPQLAHGYERLLAIQGRRRFVLPIPVETEAQASPVLHVGPGAPPMLLLHEEQGAFMADQSAAMETALQKAGVEVQRAMIPGTNHLSMLVDLLRPGNVGSRLALAFIDRHVPVDTDG